MKITKNIFVLLLTAVLSFSMVIPAFAVVAPTGATTTAGETVVLTFTYEDIAGIEGTFTYSNPDMISGVSLDVPDLEETYNPRNGRFAYSGANLVDCTIVLTVSIAADAQPGDECVVTFEYETTVDGKLPSIPSYSYDTATITIPASTPIDYTALEEQIARFEALVENQYTAASWQKAATAYAVAVELLNNAETQEDVDAAADALKTAIDNLVKKGSVVIVINYASLLNQIARADALVEDDYTAESWAAMKKVYDEGKALLYNAKTQKQVELAATNLKTAIDALVKKQDPPVVELDYTALEEQIERAEGLTEDDYTAESWAAMEAVLAEAKALLNNAETQAEVDEATKALKDAIDALVEKEEPPVVIPVDYTALEEQIERAEGLIEDDYTAESWAAVEAVLAEAKALLNNAETQAEVDEATKALKDAIDALVEKEEPPVVIPVDYTALEEQIERAEGLIEDDYTAESWAAMEAVLEEAKALLNNAETQAEVDEATKALKDAIDALVKKEPVVVIDYSALEEQIERAEGLIEDDYTAESWAAVEAVLAEAKALLNNAETQAEVDEATKALKDAIDALVEKEEPPVVIPVDYTALEEQIERAEGLIEDDYTAESWAAMEAVLAEAKALLNNAETQAEVDAAADALKTAIANLVKASVPELGGVSAIVYALVLMAAAVVGTIIVLKSQKRLGAR